MSSFTAPIGYTIIIPEGSTAHLPCHFPPYNQVKANAVWFKETGGGKRTKLSQEESSADGSIRVELLYPLDNDQTVIIRKIVMEDDGIYHCESAEGEKLSSVHIIVEGRFGSVDHR